jgi:hypothetical protein
MTTTQITEKLTHMGAKKILTVAELLAILIKLPSDTHVVIDASDIDGTSEFYNVSQVEVPSEEDGYCAVTLFCEDTFDPRQF